MKLISGGQRAKTIHSIRGSGTKILDNKVVVPIVPLINQTRQAKHIEPLCFQTYSKEPKLYVVRHLNECLERIKSYRATDELFSICIKPHRTAGKDTI